MAGGWNPKSFEEVLAQLESESMLIALRVKGTRTCPAPWWDPAGRYRVALAAGRPEIQQYKNNQWLPARVEPPDASDDEGAAAVAAAMTELFISHSSKDAELAKALVRMIDSCLDVPSFTLRCTSVAGYELEPGAHVGDELRSSLYSAKVVLGLLTENSVESAYVLMELGAAWVLRHHVIPLVSGSALQQVPGPIGADLHFVNVTDETAINGVLESIATRCGWRWRGNATKRNVAVKDFVQVAATMHRAPASTVPTHEPRHPAKLNADLAFLADYLDHLEGFSAARKAIIQLERMNSRGRASEEELNLARGARDGNAKYLEEHVLRAHDLVELATRRRPSWDGPQLRAGLDAQASADVRATIGRFREWLNATTS